MVSLETRKILMVVFSFTGPEDLDRWMNRARELLAGYCGGEGIQTFLAA